MAYSVSNKELLARISDYSDKQAFGLLFKRYHSKLVSYALCFVSHFEEAEDAVSEVFVRLLKKREQLKEIDNFEGYIYYAVKNQCFNQLKKNKRKDQLFTPIDFEDIKTGEYTQPLQQLLTDELRTRISTLVNQLPQKRRLVFKMIKDDDMSIKEVAKALDIAEKTVKKHLELAVRELRTEVSEYLLDKKEDVKIVPLPGKLNDACWMIFCCGLLAASY